MRRSVRIPLVVVVTILIVGAVVIALALFYRPGGAVPSPRPTTTGATPSSSATISPSAHPTPSTDPGDPTSAPGPAPDPTDQVQPEPTPAGPATVTIVSWGADGANVYASGVVTGDAGENGTCTLTATSSAGQTLTGRRDAQSTAAAVNCGVIQIAAPSGEWTLVLSYHSEIAEGSSAPIGVTQL